MTLNRFSAILNTCKRVHEVRLLSRMNANYQLIRNLGAKLAIALLCLFTCPATSMATDHTQDELIRKIEEIAKDEYRKHASKWTDYEKQFTREMTEREFAAYCVTTAEYEHRTGGKSHINWKAKIPIYNAGHIFVTYDYGVMQINGRIGEKYFGFLDYKNSIDDNIRAGVKHLAAGFNKTFSKGLRGLDAINYGLQSYNPCEINRVGKFWKHLSGHLRQQFTFKDQFPPSLLENNLSNF